MRNSRPRLLRHQGQGYINMSSKIQGAKDDISGADITDTYVLYMQCEESKHKAKLFFAITRSNCKPVLVFYVDVTVDNLRITVLKFPPHLNHVVTLSG